LGERGGQKGQFRKEDKAWREEGKGGWDEGKGKEEGERWKKAN
jgi:hypothetical protein